MDRLCRVILAMWLIGCVSPGAGVCIVQGINNQIAKFNSERMPDMGVTPIAARVARVHCADNGEQMDCLDSSGKTVVLSAKQTDGSFVGQIRTPYYQLPNPEGHSWGEALLEIRIEKEKLQQIAPPLPSAPAELLEDVHGR